MRKLLAIAGCTALALTACSDATEPDTVDARDGNADTSEGVTVVRANMQGAQVEFGGTEIRVGRDGVDVDLDGRDIEARVRTGENGSISVTTDRR